MGQMGRKARRNAERRRDAIRREVLFRQMMISCWCLEAWRSGIKGGCEWEGAKFEALDIPDKHERHMIALKVGLLISKRKPLEEETGYKDWLGVGMENLRRTTKDLDLIGEAVRSHLADAGITDEVSRMRCATYLNFQAFNDWGNYAEKIMDVRTSKAFGMFVGNYRGFADWIIPEGSPLCLPMSKAYFETREEIQGNPKSWGL